jgi:molybdate transport system substrate-binding protein
VTLARSWSVLALLSLAVGFGWSRPALAQETIECPEPAPAGAAATPEAATSPAAAEPVAFPEGGGDLTVFAAASLTEVFERIATVLETANDGLAITYNFAGSQVLVTQLTEGAEADVFASANVAQMDNAIAAGVIDGDPVVFAENRLAIVVPADNPAGVASLADLAGEDLDLVLAAPEVPVGQYSREAACKAAADPATYGEGFLDGFAANIVSNEDNVRAVLAKVQLGEADAGIVYATDVTPDVENQVQVIEVPDEVNVVAEYPIAPVAGGDPALAAAFVSYLLGPEGQATLAEFRFQPPR